MFDAQVTEEIQIYLVNEACASDYVRLAQKDFDYLAEWLEWPRFCVDEEDFLKFVTDSENGFKSGDSMNCAIRYEGTIAGVAGFNRIDKKLSRVEIGYWIGSDFQGKGIATEICSFLVNLAFKKFDIDVAQISVATGNHRSRAVCERLGMKLEGVISNDERIGDRVLDHAKYALRRESS